MSRRGPRDWATAREVLETLVRHQSPGGARIELGRVTYVGSGLCREAFAANVELVPDANQLSGTWVVLLPCSDDAAENASRCSRELQVLAALQQRQLPFRTPRPLGVLPVARGAALVRQFIPGVPLDLRAGRQPSLRPWEVVAEIAAGIHALDTGEFTSIFSDAPATRREHAQRELRVLETLQLTEARDAAAWAAEHLPPNDPASLLYGDLLGQNILIDPSDPRPFAAMDWAESSIGDPAYDLAIVTRGVRQPFQTGGGLNLLLDAYAELRGSDAVKREHVRLHELCFAAGCCKLAMGSKPNSGYESVDDAIARLRRVLSMATGWG